MEGAHCQETKTNRSKSERFKLDDWKTVQLVSREQIINVQIHLTYVDVCKLTMGLCKQIQHLNHSEKSIKNPSHVKRNMLTNDEYHQR